MEGSFVCILRVLEALGGSSVCILRVPEAPGGAKFCRRGLTARVGPLPKSLRPQASYAWDAHLYVSYVSWRVCEGHLYVFYNPGGSWGCQILPALTARVGPFPKNLRS